MRKYEDKGFKIVSLYLLNGLLNLIGLDVEIKEFLSHNHVNFQGFSLELDLVFLGTNGIIYHIEFQSKMPTQKDLARLLMLFSERFLNKKEKHELIEALKMRIESVEIYGNKMKEEGRFEGRQEGIEEGILETAKNMLNNGISLEDIAICTNLTIEQINNL